MRRPTLAAAALLVAAPKANNDIEPGGIAFLEF